MSEYRARAKSVVIVCPEETRGVVPAPPQYRERSKSVVSWKTNEDPERKNTNFQSPSRSLTYSRARRHSLGALFRGNTESGERGIGDWRETTDDVDSPCSRTTRLLTVNIVEMQNVCKLANGEPLSGEVYCKFRHPGSVSGKLLSQANFGVSEGGGAGSLKVLEDENHDGGDAKLKTSLRKVNPQKSVNWNQQFDLIWQDAWEFKNLEIVIGNVRGLTDNLLRKRKLVGVCRIPLKQLLNNEMWDEWWSIGGDETSEKFERIVSLKTSSIVSDSQPRLRVRLQLWSCPDTVAIAIKEVENAAAAAGGGGSSTCANRASPLSGEKSSSFVSPSSRSPFYGGTSSPLQNENTHKLEVLVEYGSNLAVSVHDRVWVRIMCGNVILDTLEKEQFNSSDKILWHSPMEFHVEDQDLASPAMSSPAMSSPTMSSPTSDNTGVMSSPIAANPTMMSSPSSGSAGKLSGVVYVHHRGDSTSNGQQQQQSTNALGAFSIPLNAISRNTYKEHFILLKGGISGQLCLRCCLWTNGNLKRTVTSSPTTVKVFIELAKDVPARSPDIRRELKDEILKNLGDNLIPDPDDEEQKVSPFPSPYVRMTFNGKSIETPVAHKTVNPKWNFSADYIHDPRQLKQISSSSNTNSGVSPSCLRRREWAASLELRDSLQGRTADRLIATASIDLSQPQKHEIPIGKKGSIRLEITHDQSTPTALVVASPSTTMMTASSPSTSSPPSTSRMMQNSPSSTASPPPPPGTSNGSSPAERLKTSSNARTMSSTKNSNGVSPLPSPHTTTVKVVLNVIGFKGLRKSECGILIGHRFFSVKIRLDSFVQQTEPRMANIEGIVTFTDTFELPLVQFIPTTNTDPKTQTKRTHYRSSDPMELEILCDGILNKSVVLASAKWEMELIKNVPKGEHWIPAMRNKNDDDDDFMMIGVRWFQV